MMFSDGNHCKDYKPLVTIITVCRNSAATIRQSIESVLNQDYDNIEYIVLDGQSTDGTINILKEYKKLYAHMFDFISEQDSGLYFAMNRGIDMANGELIGIINSDDVYRNMAVREAVNIWLKNDRPELILGSTAIMDDTLSITKGIARPVISKRKEFVNIPHPSTFISKGAYSEYGKFDTRFRYAADRDLLLRFIFSGARYKIVDSIFASFRQGGLGSRIGAIAQIENFEIDKKYISIFVAYKNFSVNYLYFIYKRLRLSLQSK